MNFNRMSVLDCLFPSRRTGQIKAHMARRWSRAAHEDRDLVADLVSLGDVFAQIDMDNGKPDTDPLYLAYTAGRRDLTLQLLALMGVTHSELSQLMMEANDVD